MPNTTVNIYTQWRGEVNTHTKLRGSPDHHTVNFFQILCHVINLLTTDLQFRSNYLDPIKVVWAVTTPCKICMAPIREPPIRVNIPTTFTSRSRTLKTTTLDTVTKYLNGILRTVPCKAV